MNSDTNSRMGLGEAHFRILDSENLSKNEGKIRTLSAATSEEVSRRTAMKANGVRVDKP